jgi:hypothetical protein
MQKKANVVEETLFQIKNLEEALQENAKGILHSTMKEEIKQLVKESLREQDEDEIEEPPVAPEAGAEDEDEDFSDELPDETMGMQPDSGSVDSDDEETIDMTMASDSEVLKVFKAMGDNDGIIVKKEDGMLNLKDGENEYMIQLGESEDKFGMTDDTDFYELDLYGDEGNENFEDFEGELDEFNVMGAIRGGLELDEESDFEEFDFEDFKPRKMNRFKKEFDSKDFKPRKMNRFDKEFDFEDFDSDQEEIVYEIVMDDKSEFSEEDPHSGKGIGLDEYDYNMREESDIFAVEDLEEEDDELRATLPKSFGSVSSSMEEETSLEDKIMEAVKKAMKPKGVGMGSPNKRKTYSRKPNMEGGFKTKMKQGTRGVGMGKAKFEYHEEVNDEGFGKNVKKVETKEASRTLGSGRYWGKNGLPKPKAAPRHLRKESIDGEIETLKEKNNEYRKALDVFRTKLNEVAVFNSNLAYATRLFTEHSTTKQEKINILRRFDSVESLKESKNLYRSIKDELGSTNTGSENTINESFERTVVKTPSTGSAVNLIESRTYENPQFLRMRDLMSKIK